MSKAKRKRESVGGFANHKQGFDPRRGSLAGELHALRDTLRTQSIRFDLVLEKMRQGLCFFDGSKRLVVANRRYAELYGIAPEAIRPGMELREIVDLRFAAGSVPAMTRAEYLEWREGVVGANQPNASVVELCNGRTIHIHHEPLPDGGWVATHDDITEQRHSEDELRRRNLRFDAAIANMSQGLCMFDAQERMIVCNLNYPTMFGLSPEFVKPGTSLYDILQHSVDIGVASDNADELYRIRREIIAARQPRNYCETLADARIIDIWHRPMADGGWVSTYDDITERRQAESRIAYVATHDALTDLPNRAFLRDRLSHLLSAKATDESKGPAHLTALLLLDLDRFKEVNDTLGHATGDKLLRMVAERLRALLGEEDLAARLGGDEFAILHFVTDGREAAILSQRVIDALIAPYDLDGHTANVGASIGISLAPGDGSDPETLLTCADLALYRAKALGRGRFAFFEAEMTASAHQRRVLELELREALIRGQFEVHYQPQVNVKTGQADGAEALIRWRHPVRGLVGPSEFISIAEEVGLIVPIGEWILRQACRDAARWREGMRVAVNLSAVQFRGDHLAEIVISALSTAGLPPARLELEVTESVLLEETEATRRTLHQLRGLGVRVSLDDFGTGYSSLSYLRSFPFDKIKIDRSFVREVTASANGAAIVRAIASLGASLGMETTAEGVETKEQLDLIRAEGCTEAQGYYFSVPRPASELAHLLGSSSEMRDGNPLTKGPVPSVSRKSRLATREF
jgi:diguanylate cyclase (GGDEF)-like protein